MLYFPPRLFLSYPEEVQMITVNPELDSCWKQDPPLLFFFL